MRFCGTVAVAVLMLVFATPPAAAQPVSADRNDRAGTVTEAPPELGTQISALYFVEAWDFNGRSPDRLQGITLGIPMTIHGGWSALVEFLGMRVVQATPNAIVGGVTPFVRRRLARTETMTFFIEGGFGVSYASAVVPENGTRFNFLLQARGGFTRRLGPKLALILDLGLLHISNNGLNGTNHNPDINSLGGHLGVVFTR